MKIVKWIVISYGFAIVMFAFMAIHALCFGANPGPLPGPQVKPPTGVKISTNAPPTASQGNLGPVVTIDVSSGAHVVVTAPRTFTQAELRRWLREAMMNPTPVKK